ncbi:MAG: hypothetical protein PHH61_03525 [Candidatus Nanoarchaeia archaeon]|nr:hypothetical protein [Candidatus Nanoarchaeia archaeon]
MPKSYKLKTELVGDELDLTKLSIAELDPEYKRDTKDYKIKTL